MKAIHLTITGRVQGVFFRATTKDKADSLGILGWVKNCADGSVEIVAQGEEDALKEFVAWCHEGPGAAEVENVEETACPHEAQVKDFCILP